MGCSVGFKYAKNALAADGALEGDTSPNAPPRLDSHAFRALILVPLWKPGAPADLELATVLSMTLCNFG